MNTSLHKIVREKELPEYTGLKRTAIADLIAKGQFPKPVRLSERAKGWLVDEIAAWQRERLAKRDASAKA